MTCSDLNGNIIFTLKLLITGSRFCKYFIYQKRRNYFIEKKRVQRDDVWCIGSLFEYLYNLIQVRNVLIFNPK